MASESGTAATLWTSLSISAVIDYDTTVLSYDELGEMTAIDHKGRSN